MKEAAQKAASSVLYYFL